MNTATPSSSLMPGLSRALSRFFAWWGGELAAMVPARLRLWWRGSGRVVLLSFEGATAVFRPLAGGRREEISPVELGTADAAAHRSEANRRLVQAAGRNFQLLLCVPPEQVLQRTLTLPLAVEENLRQTLVFELDRYTPFRAEQVYFDFRVLGRDADKKRLSVELAVVPRPAVDQAVARAASLGLAVDGAVLADEALHGGGAWRDFLPAPAKRRQRSSRPGRRAVMATLSAVLLLVLLSVPPWQKRGAAMSLAEPLARSKVEAEETGALRERLRKLVEEHNFLHDKKWDAPSTVLVLQELSRLLPDDTFVMTLLFDGKTVQILGETASPTSLVETLEKSSLFKDVSFKAQLTKIPGTPNDRFHLSATLTAAAKPARPGITPEKTGATAPASPAGQAIAPAAADPGAKPVAPSVNPPGKP